MHRPARAPLVTLAGAALAACAVSLAATACAPRLAVTRRPATPAERTAIVECAAAIAVDHGFEVTERRPDLGRLSASTEPEAGESAGAPKGGGDRPSTARPGAEPVDYLTVAISKHPIHDGLALLVGAATRSDAGALEPSPRAAVLRDRILRGCAYLVG